MVAAEARHVLTWSLTAGQAGDAPQGRQLIQALGHHHGRVALLMDSAYQDQLAASLGFIPVVPPSPQRLQPWDYDKNLYRRRNQIERLFRRVKEWRRVFTRYDKLGLMFAAFITPRLCSSVHRALYLQVHCS